MFKNYLIIAWRNLVKNKGYSAINIGGLAVGMAAAMLIGLWIYDEISYNKSFKNYRSLAQVMQHETFNNERGTTQSVPMPLIGELKDKYGSNFKHLAMASWQGDHILSFSDKKVTVEGNFMGAEIPEMLSLRMLKGNYDALKDPHSILLSATTAKAIFGEEDAVNKLIKIDNEHDVKVTGVYEDISNSTDFKKLHFIAPWDLYFNASKWVQDALNENQWDNNSFQLFAQIADNTSFKSLNKKIEKVKLNKVGPGEKKFNPAIFLHPISDWHLRSNWEGGVQTGGLIEYVWLFGIVGVFILLLACINFMNLSTARSEKRAREVGIRKAVGSARGQLIKQFFGESLLVVMVSFWGSCVIIALSLPWFNQVTEKQITFPYTQTTFWALSVLFVLITGFLAGSYPAFYLSSFNPVKVLKGTFRAGRFAALPRKVLVVMQFTVSVALIIGTMLVSRQIQYTRDRPLGYDSNGIMMVQMRSPEFYGKLDLLRGELKSNGVITEMASSSSPLNQTWNNTSGFSWAGKDPNLVADFATFRVTHEFGKTVGWEFTKGRDFSREHRTDSAAMILNEAAVKFMNIKTPLGATIEYHGSNYTIVGVVKDMLTESPYEPIKQAVYLISYNNVRWFHIKLNPAKPVKTSLASIESAFKKYIPSAPFEYQFADEAFDEKFSDEERISKLTTLFAILAIFISCLGLFGLTSFVAEQRRKEIGIRKISGATVFNLWKLLSKDFFVLVLLSCVIASPIAYYYLNGWLQNYQYRTDIGWGVFAIAMGLALMITILTVSYQAIKAALANPVIALRND
jgi:putative ABC transport system permease protein